MSTYFVLEEFKQMAYPHSFACKCVYLDLKTYTISLQQNETCKCVYLDLKMHTISLQQNETFYGCTKPFVLHFQYKHCLKTFVRYLPCIQNRTHT